jgi:hypothetical protein
MHEMILSTSKTFTMINITTIVSTSTDPCGGLPARAAGGAADRLYRGKATELSGYLTC